jgi:hypothetical protein
MGHTMSLTAIYKQLSRLPPRGSGSPWPWSRENSSANRKRRSRTKRHDKDTLL